MNRDLPYVTYRLLRMDAALPEKGSIDSAGFDLTSVENLTLSPGARAWIPTGIMFNIPRHLYGQIASRSGLSTVGIDVVAGVIDPDYQGEIRVMLVNNSATDFQVHAGDRIAQIIFIRILNQKRMYPIDHQPPRTPRGASGFGSTGMRSDPHDTSLAQNYQTAPTPSTSRGPALHPQPGVAPQMPHMQMRYPMTYSPVPDEFYNYA